MALDSAYVVAGYACLTLACSTDHPPRAAVPDRERQADEQALGIAFSPMYSAYDGDYHEFRVPVRVTGADGELEVSTSPADFVDFEPSADGVTLITRRAGRATVTITDRAGQRSSAQLIVTANRPEDVDIGMERYSNQLDGDWFPNPNVPFDAGAFAGFSRDSDGGLVVPEGGFRLLDGASPVRTSNGPAPCISCHLPDATRAVEDAIETDVEYTPQQIAGLSDEQLMRIFVDGEKPEGAHFRSVNERGAISDESAASIFKSFHSFALAGETSRGVVAYLRQLTPKSRGELDFGGLYSGRAQ